MVSGVLPRTAVAVVDAGPTVAGRTPRSVAEVAAVASLRGRGRIVVAVAHHTRSMAARGAKRAGTPAGDGDGEGAGAAEKGEQGQDYGELLSEKWQKGKGTVEGDVPPVPCCTGK